MPPLCPGVHAGPAGWPVHGFGEGACAAYYQYGQEVPEPGVRSCWPTAPAAGSATTWSKSFLCATFTTRRCATRRFGRPGPAASRLSRSMLSFPGGQSRHGTVRLAFTTDSYVVSPLFFPGGDIGKLAVCGTVNDLGMSGARPLWLSAGFIIEEGLPLVDLERIVASMAATAGKRGRADRDRRYQGGGSGQGRPAVHQHRGRGLVPAGRRALAAIGARPAMWCC